MASREPEAVVLTPLPAGESHVGSVLAAIVREAVRAELRRCGLRPPCPDGVSHRWDAEADAWVPTT